VLELGRPFAPASLWLVEPVARNPYLSGITAGRLFAETARHGRPPAYSVAELTAATPAVRQSADRVLASAEQLRPAKPGNDAVAPRGCRPVAAEAGAGHEAALAPGVGLRRPAASGLPPIPPPRFPSAPPPTGSPHSAHADARQVRRGLGQPGPMEPRSRLRKRLEPAPLRLCDCARARRCRLDRLERRRVLDGLLACRRHWLWIWSRSLSLTLGLALRRLGIDWNSLLDAPQPLLLVVLAATWNQISYSFLFFLAGLQSIPPS